MKIELEDISHGKDRKDWTYDHGCILKVKRTDDSGSVTENEEFGYLVQGKDMIFLNSQKVYLPNLPTEHQDIAGAFEEVLGKLQDGEGGDEDTYQPPEMPEPTDYEMYFLVEVVKNSSSENVSVDFEILMSYAYLNEYDNWSTIGGVGSLTIDWGDGIVSSADGYDIEAFEDGNYVGNGWYDDKYQDIRKHTYDSEGRYLIKCSCTKYSSYLPMLRYPNNKANGNIFAIAIKLGNEILVALPAVNGRKIDAETAFYSQPRLEYIKFNGTNGLPMSGFYNDYSLRQVDTWDPLKMLVKGVTDLATPFFHTYNLRKFDMSEIISLKNHQGTYCGLKELYLPLCTEMSDDTRFSSSYWLRKIILPIYEGDIPANFASSCNLLEEIEMPKINKIGTYAFSACYKLSKVDISGCTEIGRSAFNNCACLAEVYAPNCTYIDDRAFEYCCSLKKITVAEGCTFGSNCFAGCDSLFPRPDGSVN